MEKALETRVAVIETRLDERKHALELQAAEYERRLDNLNHNHEEITSRNRDFVSRELHDRLQTNVDVKFSDLSARIIAIEGRSKGIGESWGVLISSVLAAGTIITILAYFFMRG